MNRRVRFLSIVTIVLWLSTIHIFFVALKDYDYDIFTTLKECWVIFSLPIALIFLLKREKKILNLPIKKIEANVVYLQRKWVPIRHRHYLLATFELPEKTQWTFRVPTEIFNQLLIGQHGILSYREKDSKVFFCFFSSVDNISFTKNN